MAALGGVYALRMLGLFIILPVFAIYAETLTESTATLAGIAVGIYGLTSALLQIPMGWLSDRFGRRAVVLLGLLIFVLGSVVAAEATDIWQMILGRALQGAGAVSAALTAWVADLSREQVRAKVMAMIGVLIGATFIASLIVAPWLSGQVGVPGIFWIVAGLGVAAMLIVSTWISVPTASNYHATSSWSHAWEALRDRRLLLLSLGAAVIHMVLVANFMSLPLAMRDMAGLDLEHHSLFYFIVLVGSILPLFMVLRWIRTRVAQGMRWAALLLAASEVVLILVRHDIWLLGVVLLLFFLAFNILEAQFPTQVSRLCPPNLKGMSLGIFTTAQFLGAFLGGVLTGVFLQSDNAPGLYAVLALAMLLWAVASNRLELETETPSKATH